MGFWDLFKRKPKAETPQETQDNDAIADSEKSPERADDRRAIAQRWYADQVASIQEEFQFLKRNPFECRYMDKSELKRKAKIINESDTIIDTSSDNEERARRCELCIKLLYEICACFPVDRQYAEALNNALIARNNIKSDVLKYGINKKQDNKKKDYEWFCNFMDKELDGPRVLPKTPMVDGIPIFEYAETHKHDYEMMYRCCLAELEEAQRSKTVPAPFYFWRCAILAKKAKRYDIEVKVCQSYLEFVDRYSAEMVAKGKKLGYGCLDMNGSPRVVDMRKRLPKALSNLEKSKALAK